jgi:glucuronokinase
MDRAPARHRGQRRVPARVGLVGNPSDGFGGAVLAATVPGLEASVTAVATAVQHGVTIAGPDLTEEWPPLPAWSDEVVRAAEHGAHRIIAASLWTLVGHLRTHVLGTWPRVNAPGLTAPGFTGPGFNGPGFTGPGFTGPGFTGPGSTGRGFTAPGFTGPGFTGPGVTISWRTDIPASVGLAGSSALAVGTIDAVSTAWGIALDPRVCAALALAAEHDLLGITAGWQDRVVQSFGRTVLVDAATMDEVDGVAVPAVHVVDDPAPGARLLLGWRAASASSSHDYHGPLRRDTAALVEPMRELAALARSATQSLQRGDLAALGVAVDTGWLIRQSCVPLRSDHAEIVERVRSARVPATTPGSGGSVVALCLDDDATGRAREALAAAGCTTLDIILG